ncbi:MAG: hypothetical protein CFE44_24000, partial [Burkholderiales bacterium PBB4]
MTDAFTVAGEFAPAENLSNSFEESTAVLATAAELEAPEVPEVPNGFVQLGLAPELVQACKDLGYTQPTVVQSKAIPLAMGS